MRVICLYAFSTKFFTNRFILVFILGNYQIQIEGRQFNASLVYEDFTDVPNARVLHVVLGWQDGKRLGQTYHLSTLSQT